MEHAEHAQENQEAAHTAAAAALEVWAALRGSEHAACLDAMAAMAASLMGAIRRPEAEALYAKVLQLRKKVGRCLWQCVYASCGSVCAVYSKRRALQCAAPEGGRPAARQSLECVQCLPHNRPWTLWLVIVRPRCTLLPAPQVLGPSICVVASTEALATCINEQGRYAEAEALFQEAVATGEQVRGRRRCVGPHLGMAAGLLLPSKSPAASTVCL